MCCHCLCKQVVTPCFTKTAILKDDGHPDLSRIVDDPTKRNKKAPDEEQELRQLTDERFEKRHSQLELDEKKRKKWAGHLTAFDLQIALRKRSEAKKKKLKLDAALGQPTSASKKAPDHSFTFWPDIRKDHAKTILVTDALPVVAFGAPVPRFDRRVAFSLPATGINAIILPKRKPGTIDSSSKPKTDGPAASTGRRKRTSQSRYDP